MPTDGTANVTLRLRKCLYGNDSTACLLQSYRCYRMRSGTVRIHQTNIFRAGEQTH